MFEPSSFGLGIVYSCAAFALAAVVRQRKREHSARNDELARRRGAQECFVTGVFDPTPAAVADMRAIGREGLMRGRAIARNATAAAPPEGNTTAAKVPTTGTDTAKL